MILPLSGDRMIPQTVYYLPFTITAEDMSTYGNNVWNLFFVADAVASLYIDGVFVASTNRQDNNRNINNECFGIFTTYPGDQIKTWKPKSGDHVIAVVVTPYTPAWRVGFSLVAFVVNNNDNSRSIVKASLHKDFNDLNQISDTKFAISTSFEKSSVITKWLSMSCDNK